MSKTLNELTSIYLQENGIKIIHLINYLGEDPCAVGRWLKGKYNFRPDVIAKVHDFLRNSHKSVDVILNELEEGEMK